MQAIILAAGMGKRLKDLTADNTKCMIKVNGIRLIDRTLAELDTLDLNRIVIVVGYQGEKLKQHIASLDIAVPIEFVENPDYDKTNNIYSLFLAKDYLTTDDTLLLESDIIFESGILQSLVDDPRPTLALVDKYESWMDGTVVKLDDEDNITAFIPGKRFEFADIPRYYKTVNIYKFSKDFSQTHYVPFLDAYSTALGNNEYYEQVLRVITLLDDSTVKAKRLSGQLWYEIDDLQDLDIAESIFAPSTEDQLRSMSSRYGGYWRYPKLLDFCYLVNPYYPPQRLMDEMKANFETLLRQYPSGLRVNSLLAAKTFGINQSHIIVGNGAAELIKDLMETRPGKIGFVRPTFEEYPNRVADDRRVCFTPSNPDFSYTAADLKQFFEDKGISTLVLINPDNPSGNYIPAEDCRDLVAWCSKREITLVLDESFVDFADEQNATFLKDDILTKYPNLIVVKSISKSHGVPGVRLGILATGNCDLVETMKESLSIWNINSFGEFYLQIAEKYKGDYTIALAELRAERSRLFEEINRLPGFRAIPSQANYLLVELGDGITSTTLAQNLLHRDDILIKDLSTKEPFGAGHYIRVAVRNETDDSRLIEALARFANERPSS